MLFQFYLLVCLWLCWVFTAAYSLPLAVVIGGHSLVAVCRLLTPGASLVVEHGLLDMRSVVAQGCSEVCETFSDRGLNLCLLLWQADF